MNITVSDLDGAALVRLDGEVDLSGSPRLRKALLELAFARRDVVVDLSAVTYIDSSGIAALVEAYQGTRDGTTRLVLAAPSLPVMRVLGLARLDRVFTLADSVESARAAMR